MNKTLETRVEDLEVGARSSLNRDDMKTVVKEAIREWLDEKFAQLGRWSLGTFAALVLAALAYFILWAHGWKSPHP